jgi:hypothetical protein
VQNILSSRRQSKSINIKAYEIIILPTVLYGNQFWSLTLKGGHRLKVFENRLFSGIFGSKWDEMIGGWRKLHSEKIHKLNPSLNKSRMIKSRRVRLARQVERRVYRVPILIGNLKEEPTRKT